MPASEWSFYGGGLLYKAGAWKGDSDDANRLHAYVQPTVEGVRVTSAAPLPVREPVKGSALGKGGADITSAATLVAANASRTVVEISNSGTVGAWLAFGATASDGTGTYLPPGSTGYWPTTAAVSAISDTGASIRLGYTEW